MSMQTKRDLLASLSIEYIGADRKRKTEILNTLLESSQYSRKHAIKLLAQKERLQLVGTKKRSRASKLGPEALEALVFCWTVSSRVCGKRLTPELANLVENLTKWGDLNLSEVAKKQLLSVSPATVDRLLKIERSKQPRSLSHTKRSALVKSKVPVKTFGDWNDVKPGNYEIDTVSHSSSDPNGPFLSTLNMTDVATCWTIPIAIFRKGAQDVITALGKAEEMMPFPLLGLDFDNGTEFLNEELLAWCDDKKVSYWRSRPYKKNDQAWIEEKNRSVIRRAVGRDRFQGRKTWATLNELYRVLALYYNFFQPVQKLLTKKRVGAKVHKVHDIARTPYQRVLDNQFVSEECKNKLRTQMAELSILSLYKELQRLQHCLEEQAVLLPDPINAAVKAQRNATQKFTTRNAENLVSEKLVAMNTSRAIKLLIGSAPPGSTFKSADFVHLGQRKAVDKAITRLNQKGIIQRISHGTYQITTITPTPKMDQLGTILNEATL